MAPRGYQWKRALSRVVLSEKPSTCFSHCPGASFSSRNFGLSRVSRVSCCLSRPVINILIGMEQLSYELHLAMSSSPRTWIDVFALPEKSNMAVTESDPDPKVRKMCTSELSMRAWN